MEELDLKEIFNLFWKNKVQIILIVAIFMVIGVILTFGFVAPVYTSSTTLVLARIEDQKSKSSETTLTTSEITMNSQLVSTYSELVKSKKVLRTVISNLGIKIDEEKLRNNIEDPAVAAKVANEIAKVFISNVEEIYKFNNVHIVDEAEIPSEPSNINHIRDIIIFAIIGIVVSVIYVLVLNMLDTTIKSAEDVESLLGIPVLASIPIYDFEGKRRK